MACSCPATKSSSDLAPIIGVAALGLGLFLIFKMMSSRTQQPGPYPMAPMQPAALPGQTYNNLEEWEIVRNEKGRIQTIRIHRDAHVT